ncbi:MAG: hypothetical protein LBO72_09250 [Helicobacteraceae bacterium]|jgi:hypothetical protein|nr:hypothetical protein [Helicobacteraceae bacterium]
MKTPKTLKAKTVDIIIDDEGLTSFYCSNDDVYFCVAYDAEDDDLYCEFCDQSNGFYSKTLSYSQRENHISFFLEGEERFSATNQERQITVAIPNDKVKEARSCMKILFSLKKSKQR